MHENTIVKSITLCKIENVECFKRKKKYYHTNTRACLSTMAKDVSTTEKKKMDSIVWWLK